MKQLFFIILAICFVLLIGCQPDNTLEDPTETEPSVLDATWQEATNIHQTESTEDHNSATEERSDIVTPTQNVSPEINQTPTEGTTKKDNEGSATTATESKETTPPPTEETKPKEEEKQPPTEATNPPTDPTEESKPPATDPTEPKELKATAEDAGVIASKLVDILNAYRTEQGSPTATVLPGLTQYAEYRSRQLVTNFAHDTFDERAAATALEYGSYIDSALYLRIAPVSLQIMVQTGRADIDAYCDQMQRCYENETNEMCRDMILEDAQLVNYLAANEAVTRKFFLVFQYEGTAGDFYEIAKQMAEVAETALQYLDYCGLEVLRHEQYDDFLFRTLYTVYHRRSAFEVDHKALFAEVAASIHGTDEEPPEDMSEEDKLGILSVQDVLAPTECDLTNKEYILIDGTYYAYLYVSGYGYPTQTALSWLSPLVELGDGISISYYLNKRRKEQILPKVAKTTMFNRSRMRDVEDTRSDFEQLDDAISSGMYIKEQLNREGEEFFYMNTLIEVTADDPETLEQRIKQVQNRCAAMNMTIRRADYCHEQCFKSMLPLCKLDPDIDRKSRRNILTQGAAGAFPFSSFELCDDKGILMGINLHNNSTVILDNFNSDIYSNGNMAIFGMTGAGKTYTILLMAMRLRMNGVQVFVIAPEKGFEYRGPCEALGGQYIKLARGSTDCINIMDIRRTTMDIDDNLQGHESRKDSVMLDVVQDVKTYFQLRYPAMTPEERYMLNAAIIECYGNFGITKDNESILNPDGSFKEMPTLVDLYPIVNSIPELKNIAIIIRDLVESGLGGKTNVDLRSGFIVMDTSASREEDLAATTFLATVFFRDEMSKSRTRKKAVFGDELWIIAGKEGNDHASEFVIKLVKTIRGYGGIFVSCTQNTIDYFALNNGKFGDAVLNNSRLKLLLQMEEPEALKLKEKIGLSDEEVMQILRCGRGQGLLCAGKNRIAVEIRSSQTQYDLITTNRADLEKRAKENAYD